MMTMTMIIIAMLDLGCDVRHARFHPWSLVPTPSPHVSSINICAVCTVVLWRVRFSWSCHQWHILVPISHRWKLAAANLHQLQIPNLLHQPHKLPLRPLAWCYVLCHSHHKFPPEPSASDNCHSSAFSSPARASTSSSASLCHILSPAHCTLSTVHNLHLAQSPHSIHAPCEPSPTLSLSSLRTSLTLHIAPSTDHRALSSGLVGY